MHKLLIALFLTLSIPLFIGSAENAYAAAVRTIIDNPGFADNVLEDNPGDGTDDGFVSASIGFAVNFFGSFFNDLFVNNNGNTTFESGFNDFNPQNIDFTTSNRKIIAPFFSDIDTRTGTTPPLAGKVTYGQSTVDGRPAFGVNWFNVFCFAGNSLDLLNTFQLVLIDRSDINPGDFDIEFNYDEVIWDTALSAEPITPVIDEECIEEVSGGQSAKIGFADGTGNPNTNTQANNFFELAGSGVSRAFLDSGPSGTSLIQNSLNSPVLGRYIIPVRDGIPFNDVIEMIGGKIIPIESSSLLLAGAQSVAWIIPISLSIVGIGLVLVKRRIH